MYFKILLLFFSSIVPIFAQAVVIKFPNQELASEYVLPVFKNTNAVLNRSVTLSKRFEFKIAGALRTDEPFYHPLSFISSVVFYLNEFHGVGFTGIFFTPGLSATGQTLKDNGVKKEKNNKPLFYFHTDLAPVPALSGFLNYQFSPLYGKISITKKLVLNFSLYSFVGLGFIGLKHVINQPIIMIPATHFGMGQKFYFNKHFSIDVGIDFLVYKGPNSVSKSLIRENNFSTEKPTYKTFEQIFILRFLTRIGVTLLL